MPREQLFFRALFWGLLYIFKFIRLRTTSKKKFISFGVYLVLQKCQKHPKTTFVPYFQRWRYALRSLGRLSFWAGKWTQNEKIKEFLEIRLDKLSNELSWSSFKHQEVLQNSAARWPIFWCRRYALGPQCCALACKVKKTHLKIFWRYWGASKSLFSKFRC